MRSQCKGFARKRKSAMQPGSSPCCQPGQKNNPAKGKGGKGLRIPLCKGAKKIWFAIPIPGTLFQSRSKFPSFFEEIVFAPWPVAAGAGTV